MPQATSNSNGFLSNHQVGYPWRRQRGMLPGILLISLHFDALSLSWAEDEDEDEDNDVWKWLAALRAHICRMRGLFGNFLNGSACSCRTIIGGKEPSPSWLGCRPEFGGSWLVSVCRIVSHVSAGECA